MKKILLIALLFSTYSNAQRSSETQIIRIGTNPKIITAGAYNYDKTPKFSGTFSWVTRFESGNEFGVTVEYTQLNPYYFTSGFIYNYNVNIFYSNFIETKIGAEFLMLQRGQAYTNSEKQFFTSGVNAILSFNISELIEVNLRANVKYRPDTVKIWNGQRFSWGGFINIGLKFQ